MDSLQTKRAEEIFHALVDEPKDQRASLLPRRCDGDTELRALVEQLLADDDSGMGGFLSGPAIGVRSDRALANQTPIRIGRYEIVREIGRGGMAIVYEARQDQPRRTVAVKMIRSGFPSPETLRRFGHEAEILGQLHHPGLAQVYEAGVGVVEISDGHSFKQPFFAMELIRGQTLTNHARTVELSTRQKLELAARVCEAVQHAHQNGVIHRDLKPANILVDELGQPKIVDFGVARATGADIQTLTLQTDVGQLIGTIPYMSPEQVAGNSRLVDTRSDVYALGVVLYELLSGRLPHDLERLTIPEAARLIREEPPPLLSSVDRAFRGEIETIVAKAIHKDKSRRYQSAAALATDIRRYLRGEPIEAKRDSALYLLGKTVRRHRWGAIGAASFVIGLAAFAGYASIQAERYSRLAQEEKRAKEQAQAAQQQALASQSDANAQREVADAKAGQAQDVTRFLADMLGLSDPDITQSPDMTMRAMLDQASAEVGSAFQGQPEAEATIRTVIGRSYATIGELELAKVHLERALGIRKRQKHSSPRQIYDVLWPYTHTLQNLSDQRWAARWRELRALVPALVGESHSDLADSLRRLWRQITGVPLQLQQVHASYLSAIDVAAESLESRDPQWLDVADHIYFCAAKLGQLDEYGAACGYLIDALEIQQRFLPQTHTKVIQTRHLLVAFTRNDGRYAEAEALAHESLQLLQRVLAENHWFIAVSQAYLAACITSQGRFEEAEALLTECSPRFVEALGARNAYAAIILEFMIELYDSWGRPDDAWIYRLKLAEVLSGMSRFVSHDRARNTFGPDYAELWDAIERLNLVIREDARTAFEPLNELLELHDELLSDKPSLSALFSQRLYRHLNDYTNRAGFDEHALTAYRRLYEIITTKNFVHPIKKADGPFWLGWSLLHRGEYVEAERLAREYLDILGPHRDQIFHEGGVGEILMGVALAGQERRHEAVTWLVKAYQTLLDAAGAENVNTADALNRLSHFYDRSGKPETGAEIIRSHLLVLIEQDAGGKHLNRWSWRIALAAELPTQAYEVAVEAATRAAELAPKNGAFITTLGAALFRLGRHEQALETLLRAEELNAGVGRSDAVFLSMVYARLSRTSEASTWLERCRERLAMNGSNAPWRRLLLEATTLIEPQQAP